MGVVNRKIRKDGMPHCTKSNAGAFAVGAVVGLAAGATAMFFLAPRSGKASRKMVAHRIEEIKDYTQDATEEINRRVKEVFGEVNDITKALYGDARKLWTKQVKTLNTSWDQIDKDKYNEMIDNVMVSLKDSKKYSADELNKVKRYLTTEVKKVSGV